MHSKEPGTYTLCWFVAQVLGAYQVLKQKKLCSFLTKGIVCSAWRTSKWLSWYFSKRRHQQVSICKLFAASTISFGKNLGKDEDRDRFTAQIISPCVCLFSLCQGAKTQPGKSYLSPHPSPCFPLKVEILIALLFLHGPSDSRVATSSSWRNLFYVIRIIYRRIRSRGRGWFTRSGYWGRGRMQAVT